MSNHFDFSDEQFQMEFENCTLPPDLFSHEAHLRFAWIHIKKDGYETAIKTICKQLTAFVNHVGAHGKYNKTLTVTAIMIVYHFMKNCTTDNFFDYISKFPRLKTDFKGLVKSHYSFDIFNFEKAKTEYLEPDLLPFDYDKFSAS